MKLTLEKRYLVFPVNKHAAPKKICLSEAGTLLFDFDCSIDLIAPNFTAFVDVARYQGKTVEITTDPEMTFPIEQTDEPHIDGLYRERYRPQIHFTVKSGWNNDPNGLIFHEGIYHMFYQYNPCDSEWGNMHWGHATSRDLLHWEELPCALSPDEFGTMFSGSAITDTENRTGFGKDGKAPMLLFYTAAAGHNLLSAGKERTQCLAFSRDDGRSFQKYAGNPIVPHIRANNRDPKVVFVPELGQYIMVIYLVDELYHMLSSDDLIHWTPYQTLRLPHDAECPDFYPLNCEGRRFWVLSGASDRYILGHFEDGRFVQDTEEAQLTYSDASYAGQSFSGAENGRVVRLTWHRINIPEPRFTQEMSIPTEMSLRATDNGIRLCAVPVRELETLRTDTKSLCDVTLSEPLVVDVGAKPIDLTIRIPGGQRESLTMELFGAKLTLDTENDLVRFREDHMPLGIGSGDRTLRVVADRCSIELFADGGRFCMTEQHQCDYNLPAVRLTSSGAAHISSLSCSVLRSVLPQE